jgi:antitoxin ChpS
MKMVHVRKQGGAAIITIPPDLLRALHVAIGSTLKLDINDGKLTASPVTKKLRKRYTLRELLEGSSPNMKALGSCEEKPVGREIL